MSYSAPGAYAPGHAITTTTTGYCQAASTIIPVAASTYPTADLAIYVPILVPRSVVVVKLWASVSTSSGSLDLGIYSAGGTRLASTGTTASAQWVVGDITDTLIGPGRYYLAFVADNTTIQLYRDIDPAPTCAALGVLTEQLGTGAALPATASWAVPQTLAYYPLLAALLDTTVT